MQMHHQHCIAIASCWISYPWCWDELYFFVNWVWPRSIIIYCYSVIVKVVRWFGHKSSVLWYFNVSTRSFSTFSFRRPWKTEISFQVFMRVMYVMNCEVRVGCYSFKNLFRVFIVIKMTGLVQKIESILKYIVPSHSAHCAIRRGPPVSAGCPPAGPLSAIAMSLTLFRTRATVGLVSSAHVPGNWHCSSLVSELLSVPVSGSNPLPKGVDLIRSYLWQYCTILLLYVHFFYEMNERVMPLSVSDVMFGYDFLRVGLFMLEGCLEH